MSQLAQAYLELPFLPPFQAWHSGMLPYPLLVVSQVAILVFYTQMCLRFSSGRVQPSVRAARIQLGVGAP